MVTLPICRCTTPSRLLSSISTASYRRCSTLIDLFSQIFTPIAKAVRTEFSGVSVTGEYVKEPASFPHVSIVEADNYMTVAHLDSSTSERFATLMYEVNVYSNKLGGKQTEARSIMNLIDGMMYSFNFTRLMMTPVPNLEDSTIYRITARYRAETDGTNISRI